MKPYECPHCGMRIGFAVREVRERVYPDGSGLYDSEDASIESEAFHCPRCGGAFDAKWAVGTKYRLEG